MNTEKNNDEKTKQISLTGRIIIVIGLTLIIGGIYSYISAVNKTPENVAIVEAIAETETIPTPESPTIKPQPTVTAITEVNTPEEATVEEKAEPAVELPLLDNSDPDALTSIQQLSSLVQYGELLIKKEIIRNFVVFVDNFSRGELVSTFSPLKKPKERFSVTQLDHQMFINPESYSRYNIYAQILNSIDVKFAIKQYRTLKPLFDEAYREIGYPEDDFDNKLNDAIDVVLDTPIIHSSIELVAPSAMYKFADPELEALPDAQKLIIRMGPDNILQLKAKLLQIQNALQIF